MFEIQFPSEIVVLKSVLWLVLDEECDEYCFSIDNSDFSPLISVTICLSWLEKCTSRVLPWQWEWRQWWKTVNGVGGDSGQHDLSKGFARRWSTLSLP